ncbi:thyrotroph embryonic factor isoform X2 [Salmo salar]|uniref:Thyrotroph embryonic factor isoform X2 n=1 Tax=Salmo salar TaxID=8030 RepID=A0A1S3Q5A5_SALSA|nr:thyrotroph embryonic factor isoform X2 [Salmo salar]|eukprot:XP_014035106.1 PREDICTED: thyrotroph embryonic factor-like isoform X2 [Salmo salar]
MSSEIPEIFKALLEDPFTVPTFDYNDNDKDKLFTGDNVDLGGGSGMGPSAALTPAIWDKTIPYNLETFHLEYMDLEEFLIENGIPTLSLDKKPTSTTTAPAAPISLLPVLELDQCEEEVVTITLNSADITANTEVVTDKDRLTPETIDPEEIEVNVNFDPDPTDLVLSSVPGGELFNPRKHKFSEEELKPQPMIKKAKKVYVPEDSKDEKYWQRRKKNNVAAKRSRDARRLKENQITVRAAFLERENTALRQEVGELRNDFARSKNVVARYVAKFGELALLEDQ